MQQCEVVTPITRDMWDFFYEPYIITDKIGRKTFKLYKYLKWKQKLNAEQYMETHRCKRQTLNHTITHNYTL